MISPETRHSFLLSSSTCARNRRLRVNPVSGLKAADAIETRVGKSKL